MTNITRDKVKEIIDNRPEGVSPEDVVNGLLARGHTLEGFEQPEEPGLVKSVVQGTLQAPARIVSSALDVGEGMKSLIKFGANAASAPFRPDYSVADAGKQAVSELEEINKGKERDFGWFGGKVRRVGQTSTGEQLKGARMLADAAGVAAETGSLAMPFSAAPGVGVWRMIGQGIKSAPALTFGIGTGLQEFAETGSAGKGVATGAVDTIGSGIAFGVFNRGGEIVSKFGSRFLASKTTQALATETKNFFDKTFSAMKDGLMSRSLSVDDLKVSNRFKETYSAFERDFNNLLYRNVQNVINDSEMAYGRDPKIVQAELSRRVASEVNGFFNLAEKTYASADNTDFRWNDFERVFSEYQTPAKTTVDDLVKLAPSQENAIKSFSNSGLSPDEIARELNIEVAGSSRLDSFVGDVFEKLRAGNLKASEVLNEAYRLAGIGRQGREIKALTPDEQAVSRQLGFKVFDVMEDAARQAGRQDVLDILLKGRSEWRDAVNLADSNVLNNLKNSGNIDDFITKIANVTNDITANEKSVLEKAMIQNPREVEEMFVNAILRKVKEVITPGSGEMPNPQILAEGAKVLEAFLDKRGRFDWAQNIMRQETAENLRLTAAMMRSNFDDALLRLKQLSGNISVTEQDMLQMMMEKGNLQISEALKKSDLPEFGEALVNNLRKHAADMEPFIRRLPPNEKQLASISIMHRLFDENQVLLGLTPDGKYEAEAFAKQKFFMSDSWKESFLKTHEQIKAMQISAGDKSIYGLLEDETIKVLDRVAQNIKKEQLAKEMKPLSIKPFIDMMMGSVYIYSRWFPGAQIRFMQAFAPDSADQKLVKQAVAEEVQRLGLRNGVVTVGDFIQTMARFAPIPQQMQEQATQAVSGGGDSNSPKLLEK